VRLSNGPTLSFHLERYSLVKDIISSSRHAKHVRPSGSTSAPLVRPPAHTCFIHKIPRQPLFLGMLITKLVLASFPPPSPTTPHHLTLVMKPFQTLFPLSRRARSHSPRLAAQSSLYAYNAERGTIDRRHYRITVKPYGVSRRVRRALQLGGTSGGGGRWRRRSDRFGERHVVVRGAISLRNSRVLLNSFFFSQGGKIGGCGSEGIARCQGKVEEGASGGARVERATQKGIGGKLQGECSWCNW